MGDARRRQKLADSWARVAEKRIAEGRPEFAMASCAAWLLMAPWRESRRFPWRGRDGSVRAHRTWREGNMGGHFTWLHARAGDEKRR